MTRWWNLGGLLLMALTVVLTPSLVSAAQNVTLTGAGSSFDNPLFTKAFSEYTKQHPDVRINYQSVGSGAGIKQLTEKTVDFGATDAPMNDEQLTAAGGANAVVHVPVTLGAVGITYQLPSVKEPLKLDGAAVAGIFLGKITKWNDDAIKALNPGVDLPSTDIAVVTRSDGSGTTFLFTNYLAKTSADWKSTVGEGTAVKWPAPTSVGGKGNEGVANYVGRIDGSIGYVEYAYAKQNKLKYALMQNRDGQFVAPEEAAFKAAAAAADWPKAPGMYLILTDQSGKASWPITGASFILLHTRQERPENAKEVLKFFDWAFKSGDQMAADLDYVAIPDAVVKMIQSDWKAKIKDAAGKALY